jgi:CheY-like chemotaxis protein
MSEDRTKDAYSSGKSLRILVVEDHGDTLQALSNLLTHFGHEISVADDAESAREIIRSKDFDVVLADIALPDGSGYDLVAEAKRKRPVKAVALTGFGAPDDIERGKEAGFDFHLTKPVDFHELRAVLGQIAVYRSPPAKVACQSVGHFETFIPSSLTRKAQRSAVSSIIFVVGLPAP